MKYSYDYICFKASYRTPDMHQHFAKHILIADDGELECDVDGEQFKCKGLIIQSNIPHTVHSGKTPITVFLIDETCAKAKIIDIKYLKKKSYYILDEALVCNFHRISCNEMLSVLGLNDVICTEYDERIKLALEIIDNCEMLETGIINTICDAVFLSESRLSHIFREQVGISIAGYVLFSKLSKTYDYIAAGESITDAAIHAGFSSSAHFAAVNKKQFGISASELGTIAKIIAEK